MIARALRFLRRFLRRFLCRFRLIDALLPPARVHLTEAQWLEQPEDYGCCALDDAKGSGHDGPCAWKCSDCAGTGRCLDCARACLCDDVVQCEWCDGNHTCPSCYEGLVQEVM